MQILTRVFNLKPCETEVLSMPGFTASASSSWWPVPFHRMLQITIALVMNERVLLLCSRVGFRLLLNMSSTLLFINPGASKPSVNTGSLLKPGDTSAHLNFKNTLMKRFCKPSDEGKVVIKTEARLLYWAALLLGICVPIFGTNPVSAARVAPMLLYPSLQYAEGNGIVTSQRFPAVRCV